MILRFRPKMNRAQPAADVPTPKAHHAISHGKRSATLGGQKKFCRNPEAVHNGLSSSNDRSCEVKPHTGFHSLPDFLSSKFPIFRCELEVAGPVASRVRRQF